MSHLMEQLSEIYTQVKTLGGQVAELKRENNQLKAQLAEALQQMHQKEGQISDLEEKRKLITLAKSLPDGESRKDVKLKINDMVREIDKCISLLNS